jgi:ArsR family metal-binding transcriptional regulator
VKEEKVRSLLREHFFDLEEEIKARPASPLGRDLKQRIAMKKEKDGVLERLPKKDCAACGAPDCETLAEDIVLGERGVEDCLFVKIESLTGDALAGMEGRDE